jgi:hypothetical protein
LRSGEPGYSIDCWSQDGTGDKQHVTVGSDV